MKYWVLILFMLSFKSIAQPVNDLLEVNGTKQYFSDNKGEMVDVVLRSNPEFEPYIDVVQAWEKKYYAWSEVRKTLAPIWKDHFSDPELKEIAHFFANGRDPAFLTTPTGMKYKLKVPTINQELKSAAYKYYKEVVMHLDIMVEEKRSTLNL